LADGTALAISVTMHEIFRRMAARTAHAVGSAFAFMAAMMLLIGWLLSGPAFGFSDTWQLIINTTTTIVTFLMVFLIQNTQNRDAISLHLKLDELIRATGGARNGMIDLDDLSDQKLHALQLEYKKICAMSDEEAAQVARKHLTMQ
jgi:low affinity Fe/Cu permease